MASYLCLLVLVGVSSTQASAKTWASIELSNRNPFPMLFDPVVKKYGAYWGANKTDHTNPILPTLDAYRIWRDSDNGTIIVPINPTLIGQYSDPNINKTIISSFLLLGGTHNINPYYGTGLEAHWTLVRYKVYKYHYKRVNLGQKLLSQICIKDCYCWVPHVDCSFDN